MKERSSEEQGGQESRTEEGSTAPSLVTVKDETLSYLTSGSSRGNHPKHEKSDCERLDGVHAGEKAGSSSIHTEKANGSATADKSKKTKGDLPFTKQEREEMETLLNELCGHLGQYSIRVFVFQRTQICTCVHHQLFSLLDFWKEKTSRRIFCLTPTGCYHYQYTTRQRPYSYQISSHTIIHEVFS